MPLKYVTLRGYLDHKATKKSARIEKLSLAKYLRILPKALFELLVVTSVAWLIGAVFLLPTWLVALISFVLFCFISILSDDRKMGIVYEIVDSNNESFLVMGDVFLTVYPRKFGVVVIDSVTDVVITVAKWRDLERRKVTFREWTEIRERSDTKI